MSTQISRIVENKDERAARLGHLKELLIPSSQFVGQPGDRLLVVTYLLYGSFQPDTGKPWPATFVMMDGRVLLGHLPAGTVSMIGDYYTLDCLIEKHIPINPMHATPIDRTKVLVLAAKHRPFYQQPAESAY